MVKGETVMAQGYFQICDSCDKHQAIEVSWDKTYPSPSLDRGWYVVNGRKEMGYRLLEWQWHFCSKECLKNWELKEKQ